MSAAGDPVPTTQPDETTLPPILTTIANLKRSVTARALGLVTTTPTDREGLQYHRTLYRRLDEIDLEIRAVYGLANRSELPRWVQGG